MAVRELLAQHLCFVEYSMLVTRVKARRLSGEGELTPRTLADDPDARISFDWHDIDRDLISSVMLILSHWANIEAGVLKLASQLADGNPRLIATMVGAIHNDGAQRAAIEAVGKHVLSDADFEELFLPSMKKIEDKRKTRNKYAHSVFASSPDIPNTLLLISPKDLAAFWPEVLESRKLFDDWLELPEPRPDRPIVRYPRPSIVEKFPESTINDHLAQARRMQNIVSLLIVTLGPQPWRPELRDQLRGELGS